MATCGREAGALPVRSLGPSYSTRRGAPSVVEGTEVRKLTELEDRHWWYRERRALLARAIRDLPPGDALGVGAAGGGNTRVLLSAGWRAAALEFGADGAQVCHERGIPVLRGDA